MIYIRFLLWILIFSSLFEAKIFQCVFKKEISYPKKFILWIWNIFLIFWVLILVSKIHEWEKYWTQLYFIIGNCIWILLILIWKFFIWKRIYLPKNRIQKIYSPLFGFLCIIITVTCVYWILFLASTDKIVSP